VASRPEALAWHCASDEKLQSPAPPPKSQPLMQYGKSLAAPGVAAKAAQIAISASNAFRMDTPP
jgi:hypothetical protein